MKAKVLIVDDNDTIRSKLKAALLEGPYELIEAASAKTALELVRSELPALIFLDIHMAPGMDGLEAAAVLKRDPLTRDIPLIHLSLSEEAGLREKSLQCGADGFIQKPFFAEEIQSKARDLIMRRGRFTTSYTARFVRSLIAYAGSSFSAGRMANIGRQICRALEVDDSVEKDILQAVRLLSCALEDGNTQRVITLYNEMGFARAVAEILSAAPDNNLPGAIVWALFCHESRALQKPRSPVGFGRFQGVFDQIGALYAAPAVAVESPRDLEYAQGELGRIFGELAPDERISLWRSLSRILTHELAYHDGALFYKEGDRLVIQPKNTEAQSLCLDRISAQDSQLRAQLSLEKRLGHPVIILAPRPASPITIDPDAAPKPAAKTLDAKTFLIDSPLSHDDLEDLRLLEIDMQEFLEEISYTHHPHEALLHLNALLGRYASILLIVNEFSTLGGNLMNFTNELAQLQTLSPEILKKLSVLFSALVRNLAEWRETVFIRQDTDDVHFLDSSLLADCDQALAVLRQSDTKTDESDEIELF